MLHVYANTSRGVIQPYSEIGISNRFLICGGSLIIIFKEEITMISKKKTGDHERICKMRG